MQVSIAQFLGEASVQQLASPDDAYLSLIGPLSHWNNTWILFMNFAIVGWNSLLIAHSFFCLGLFNHLDLLREGRQFFIMPLKFKSLVPRQCWIQNAGVPVSEWTYFIVKPSGKYWASSHTSNSSEVIPCKVKSNLLFRLVCMKKEFTSYITSMCYSDDRGSISYGDCSKNFFLSSFLSLRYSM